MNKHFLVLLLLILLLTGTKSDTESTEETQHTSDIPQEQPHTQQQHTSHYHSINSAQFWINAGFVIFLVCGAGFFSGNTVGLLSINTLDLEIQLENGNQQEKQQAETILKVVQNHHLLLSTLLLCNALAMETLPIVMHTLVPAWLAILFSTVFVLLAGEIIPQALCTGPNKMRIAELCAPYVGILIKIFWIVCYPLAKALDWMFGEHSHTRIEKKDLKNLLKLQDESTIKKSESLLLTSILSLREQRVDKIMIPLKDVYMLNANSVLDKSLVTEIKKNNHTFIPLYSQRRNNIICIMKTKELAIACFDKSNYGKRLSKIINSTGGMLSLYQDTNLLEILMLFEDKAERVALVVNQKRKTTPGLESIYYSKSDMVYQKEDKTEILGIVLLNTIFETIAAYQGTEPKGDSGGKPTIKKDIEMSDLNKPLLH